jgi:energy-coupling factor transporter ATP-binding protein EcfA2
MRIISAKLKSYRVHGELSVSFDPNITLIGGPNESGKSTLTEAIHRALFLKSSGRSELHTAMKSFSFAGNPEVELHFEANGELHQLRKRFLTNNNGTTLTSSGAPPLQGDQAEERLSELLHAQTATGKKGVTSQWSHLWVWQGEAANNPSDHATSVKDDLLLRLQNQGAGSVMQSAFDQKVGAHFRKLVEDTYTKQGKPKANSELLNAIERSVRAMEVQHKAQDSMLKLEQAVEALERSTRELADAETALERLKKEQESLRQRETEISTLRVREAEDRGSMESEAGKLETLRAADLRIRQLENEISQLESDLAPGRAALERLGADLEEARLQASNAAADYDLATDSLRILRLKKDLSDAFDRHFVAAEKQTMLAEKQKQVAGWENEIAGLNQKLHALPEVTKPVFRKIEQIKGQLAEATATLNAMGVEVFVIESTEGITAAGASLKSGESRHLTEVAEIQIGTGVRIRISPGGASKLSEARAHERDLRLKLQKMLDDLGVFSAEKAAEVQLERESIEAEISKLQQQLKLVSPETIAAELAEAGKQLTETKTSIERFSEQLGDFGAPTTKETARVLKQGFENELDVEERRTARLKKSRDDAAQLFGQKENSYATQQKGFEESQRLLEDKKNEHRLLVNASGNATTRSTVLAEQDSKAQVARERFDKTQTEIAELQPELLKNDHTRVDRSIADIRDRRKQLDEEQVSAKTILRLDGSEDPKAALAQAVADADQAARSAESVQRRFEAYRLVDTLFSEEQQRLTDLFTRPLEDKISGYLQCIFGPSAKVGLRFSENEFAPVALARASSGGGSLEFQHLSAGTREQTAAAVRLAMAEVLAEEHGGCLPVVFDDAFTNSDPDRVQKLQRMLDLAAGRGLQVIVLSCNPSEYTGLGAKTVMFAPPAAAKFIEISNLKEQQATAGSSTFSSGARPGGTDDVLRKDFVGTLEEMGGNAGNGSLRGKLGWDEETYAKIRGELLSQGVIQTGRGRGGVVMLTETQSIE